jgi:hypothetical protein
MEDERAKIGCLPTSTRPPVPGGVSGDFRLPASEAQAKPPSIAHHQLGVK